MLMMMMVMIIKVFGGNDFSNSKEMRSNTKSKLEQLGMSMTVPMVDPANKKEKKRDAGCPLISVRKVQHKKKFKTILWIKNVFFLKAADSLKTRGGPGRNNELLIEIAISKMAAQHEVYLATREEKCPVSRQVLLVPGMEIRDR